jgi:hypothetical protein
MKGLFYVHSAITEKISREVARRNHDESLFVEDYRYSCSFENSIGVEELYDLRPNDGVMAIWKRIIRGDDKLKSLVGEKFHLYAHHVSYKEVQIIMSHKMCRGHSIIEEGLDSYLTENVVEKKLKGIGRGLREKAKYMMRVGEKEFFRGDEDKYYATNKKAFPGRGNKEVVELKFGGEKLENRKGCCILVCESMKYWGKEMSCRYLSSLAYAARMIKEEYKKVYFKVHPDSYGKWEEGVTKQVLREFGPVSEEIERSQSIEDLAIGAGLDVFVYLSSVGLYCGMFSDASVYSFYQAAPETTGRQNDPDLESLQYVPDVYWDHVQLLNQGEA